MTPLALSQGALTAIASVAAAAVTGFFGLLAIRAGKRQNAIDARVAAQGAELARQVTERGRALDAQNQSYDQIQEDVKGLREELAALKKAHASEIAELRNDLGKSQRRERILEGYTWDLRHHIEMGGGRPPPDWPAGLGER